MSNYKYTPITVSDTTDYLGRKTNLTSKTLQSIKNSKTITFLIVFGTPLLLPCWSKQKFSKVPETFLESFVFDEKCTLGTSLSV